MNKRKLYRRNALRLGREAITQYLTVCGPVSRGQDPILSFKTTLINENL